MSNNFRGFLAFTAAAALAASAGAQITNVRITEVIPTTEEVEITNTGGAFTTTSLHPFCHTFIYPSLPIGTVFGAGARLVVTVPALADADSDLWLYTTSPFTSSTNMIHGLKWGPAANVGRMSVAAAKVPPAWPSTTVFAPAPPAGMSLAWDGFGNDPRDWYVDQTPTLGLADSTPTGTVPTNLAAPAGEDDYEAVSLGDEVSAMVNYVVVNDSAPGVFTIRSVNDVLGVVSPRPGSTSTRWLRVRDQDAANVQNRFYTGPVTPESESNYTWTWHINLEATPPGGTDTKPRLVIQHFNNASFVYSNAWGIEFTSTGANLVVTGIGGAAASTPLYSLTGSTAVGQWVELTLSVDFDANTVSATANGGSPVSLPIALSVDGQKNDFRFCYRGEGTGNINTMLIDDVSIAIEGAGCPNPQGGCDRSDIFPADEGDCLVDLSDLGAVLANFEPGVGGKTRSQGDIFPLGGGDTIVDLGDLGQMLADFNTNCQ